MKFLVPGDTVVISGDDEKDSERKKILSYMYRYHVDGEIKCLISEVFFDIFGKK